MITLTVLFAVFSALYIAGGLIGMAFKLAFGVFKCSFGIAVFLGALVLRLVFAAPLLYAIIWALIIYFVVRGIASATQK